MSVVIRSLAVLAPLWLGAAACSVLLDPEKYDDVARCRYDADCPASEDPRYALVCTVSEKYAKPDFPKICAPVPALSCAPDDYAGGSTLRIGLRDAEDRPQHYLDRCDETGPVQGCSPEDGECFEGLARDPASGRCDDANPDTPPAVSPQPSVAGQDVLDQFCRSAFCNPHFTCDRGTDTCVVCTLGLGIGQGGCGDLYPGGKRSPIYLDDDAIFDACPGADGVFEDVAIGEFDDAGQPLPPERADD